LTTGDALDPGGVGIISGTSRLLATTLRTLRDVVRRTCTTSSSPGKAEKFGRTLLMLIPFSIIVLLLRLRLLVSRPISVKVRTEDGDVFDCHPPDLIQLYLWVFGIWEPDLTHFIRRRLKPGDLFVDVGANIGYFSVVAARAVGDSGKVVAVEASPRVFQDLQQTLRENGCSSTVRTVNVAATAKAGSIPVYAGPAHNTGLTSTVERWGRRQQATVEALPLDDILTAEEMSRVRVLKIDVEGGEDQVLAGMARVISDAPRDLEILVELSPQWWANNTNRPIDVLEPFIDGGFHVYAMENSYWPWRYLWPKSVPKPRRMRAGLEERKRRIDVVLAREDADAL
jgi:FkbM family methyltransferase